ncbi:MAG: ATP-binding protein [Nitrososphaerales archaeon]|nr:ATP-binding protein [Nitrososphaerales archaeon]
MPEKQSQEGAAVFEKGVQPFKVRARIMLILGEQLIRDEVSAVFELVKNSYDADATKVSVTLDTVESQSRGKIIVTDDGIGMTRKKLLESWLEIGTISKSSSATRKSPGGRVYLGEKGIGRFAVHKLGKRTDLTTRAAGSSVEVDLVVDWNQFEQGGSEFLDKIPVTWNEHEPRLFVGGSSPRTGTKIAISSLQTTWTQEMVNTLGRNLSGVASPLAGLKNFAVDLEVVGSLTRPSKAETIDSVLSSAPYKFDAIVDKNGNLSGKYSFFRPDLPELKRSKEPKENLLDPTKYPRRPLVGGRREPTCGPFNFKLFAWDLRPADKKAVFGDIKIYNNIVRPNCGIRVFRDGFRILPYGNPDDDWLSLDARRVGKTFESQISRNQVFGTIEITSKDNSGLRDKSDRGGLIDNEPFKDFVHLVLKAIGVFESQRSYDHNLVEKAYGRTRADRLARIQKGLIDIEEKLKSAKGELNVETTDTVLQLIADIRTEVTEVVEQIEEPLLVAAAVGLSYMVPSHEALRDLQRIKSTLQRVVPNMPDGKAKSELQIAWRLAARTDELVTNLAKVFKRGRFKEVRLDLVARQALDLIKGRMEDAGIKCTLLLKQLTVKGSERLLTTFIMNLLDNSLYWLGPVETGKREINLIVGSTRDGHTALVVSDSGPGLQDDIEFLAQPFITNKPDGMGLGLYIASEIALAHGGRLRDFSRSDMSGLLKGASVGMTFPKTIQGDAPK